MENDKTINPELVKWCAEKARPEYRWAFHPRLGHLCQLDAYGNVTSSIDFSPLTSADDLVALQMALMSKRNGAWIFSKDRIPGKSEETHLAHRYAATITSLDDESFPLLLYKAASAQSGIPMYV